MIRKATLILMGIASAFLVFLSCTPAQPPPPATTAPVQGTGSVQKATWEQDWESTLAAARKERPVVIYSGGSSDVRQKMTAAFKEKFGLDSEWLQGPGTELPAKIIKERQAGLFVPDFIVASTTAQLTVLKPQGILEPIKPLLVLPEVLDKNLWFGGDIPWVDKEKMYTMNSILSPQYRLIVNSTMVKPEEIKSYNDLLDPRWKGKIVVNNPAIAVRPFTEVAMVMGYDFWKKLVQNDPVVVDLDRQGLEWLGHGKYPVMIASRLDEVAEFMQAGVPLARVIPKEASFLAGGGISTSMINRAPHPNAAKIWANWFLSKDGAALQSRTVGVQSGRLDVPTDHLAPETLRNPSLKYMESETEEFFAKLAADRPVAREMFGPLMKR